MEEPVKKHPVELVASWNFNTEKNASHFLQAVVAASTQGEDRKEAPSDDLTPGSIYR